MGGWLTLETHGHELGDSSTRDEDEIGADKELLTLRWLSLLASQVQDSVALSRAGEPVGLGAGGAHLHSSPIPGSRR